MSDDLFKEGYTNLNKKQKEAVDSIEGPVMVVAGPGTGKTQVLAFRIANILMKTDTPPEGILCLTFTNAGVSAMRNRLLRYIGQRSREVSISTFHSFAIRLVEEYYDLLGFKKLPSILGDDEAVFLIDDILNNNSWEHISPLSNRSMYFNDLRQLISLFKRDGVKSEDLLTYINSDILDLTQNTDNISSRGESKGKLKKEIIKKIESLEKTKEIVEFYKIYEEKKKSLSFLDYDDVLEYALYLVNNFENIKSDIRENYLYVLVDEHQDSSGIQNDFIKAIWKDVENPNIFVVGDDRQLIYGFSGAHISYFEDFSYMFGKAKLIVLNENYRSTTQILGIADELLKSSITKDRLNSSKGDGENINLSEYNYPRDEIIGAGLYFKNKIESGIDSNECALLVPRNYQVKEAVSILSNMGLPVSGENSFSLLNKIESSYFRRVLGLIVNPFNHILLSKTLLDKTSDIDPISAHLFLHNNKSENLTIDILINQKEQNLFEDSNQISIWGKKLKNWINRFQSEGLVDIINILGNELLINTSNNNNELVERVEIVRSFIHLALMFEGANRNASLESFVNYLDKIESYNTSINIAKFGKEDGIKVMTLHKSKGLEYEAVWIAHMNEEILMTEKRNSFTLPEQIKENISRRSIEEAKKELYVAITRAKSFCNISYSASNYKDMQMELSSIIRDLSKSHFIEKTKEETEKELLSNSARVYTSFVDSDKRNSASDDIKELVKKNYSDIKVSVSMLNNFFECPWKWYFRNFLKLPEPKQKYLLLGTIVHSLIEFILNKEKLPKKDDINKKIESELAKEILSNKSDFDKLYKKISQIIDSWIDNYYKNIKESYKTERSISYKDKDFSDLLMYGKIDLTEYSKNGDMIITDFKTGSSKTKNIIEKVDENGRMSDLMRQLVMYNYLILGNEKESKNIVSKLLFLEEDFDNKNSVYETIIDQEKIDLLKKDIKDYEESLKNGSFLSNKCNFKSYGSTFGECEYCKLASNILS